MNRLDTIIKEAVYEYVSKELNMDTSEDHIFSDKFEKKMRKLIGRREKVYYYLINTRWKRAIAAVVTVFIITGTAMSMEPVREVVEKFIVHIFEKYSSITFINQENEIVFDRIYDVYEPSYIPDGYKITKYEVEDIDVDIRYENGSEVILFKQDIKTGSGININTENVGYKTTKIVDTEYIYYENLGRCGVLWEQYGYVFFVSSNNMDEAFKVALSVSK